MSRLTIQLLGRRARASRSAWPARFAEIATSLVESHGVPRLGNYRDPAREIFYILLSAKTTDSQYRRTYQRLVAQFPTLSDMAGAKVGEILGCIESGGLARKKASQIKRTALALIAEGGDNPTQRLREMTAREAFLFLTNLPGVGPKSAFCVMMYSLDLDVFPVDANVQRIAERMGAISHGLKHYQAQARLPLLIPAGVSRELHIAMVVHGRKVCLPRKPNCAECCIRDRCKLGTARMNSEEASRG